MFSLELTSRSALRTATLGDGQGDRVTIEGTIGSLRQAEFVEGTILELAGTRGTLRVDLCGEDLATAARNRTGGEAR